MNRHSLPLVVALLVVPAARAQDTRHFETRVRPLLAENCFKCHGPDRQRGDLRLDTADGFKKGGGSGTPLVTPARPDDSLLLRAVRHADGVEKMPPEGKLTAAQVADLAAWVKAGAPYPASVAKAPAADPAKHWAFLPLQQARNPKPEIHNPIDGFVLAKLAAAGLTPAPPADARALIRRATFDLTGLPPTPDEIDAFLRDSARRTPDAAFEAVVDRLLASPAYGERWGRHWLDVARYADSNGLDENVAHGTAWRYRDYVVRSLNADKPYDQFLREQLAGDLLPAADPAARAERLVATGFLALGPKVLAEPDEKRMELDIVDEQIDTVGRAVLGMTFGCARCHDHKFDPIEQADYYGLAGVFVSTRTMEHFKKVARWHENSIATPAEQRAKAQIDAAGAVVKSLPAAAAALAAASPDLPTAMGVADGTPTDVRVLRRGNHLTPADVVPRRFPLVFAGAGQPALPKGQSGRLELAAWLTDPRHPLTARVIVNRVWRWHFGKGLVRSVDNFGLTGDAPTHPELLDYLAAGFTADGWSLKRLHRRIMLSATYRMSTAHDAKAATADPDNRLLWRANPRRLEAEAIRDSLLAVGGLLDRTAGGPALAGVKNRDYLFDHTSKDRTSYASDRRSLYLPVIRNNLYDVFQLFDAPDPAVPTGDRATTTVPTQALFFLNSDLSARAADALAGRLLAAPGLDDAGRVRLLFEFAYSRPPTTAETARVVAGVAAFEADAGRRAAWAAVCQAVLAGNEFIHLN
ncbi:PSD1 and planctomycete cytochrome C domain-containing protein [Urbifossiella limnaea]|uniref:Planctomycete cytochrome C n=1 Tax=Urbifossiella limnaea TaxID=2528023 RepID=A0A517Y2A9_9BACT|nr:PSD1 and planctomycete cytochrome C domain-containing protein [Urbifossiella limnaea]QDU23882.1 Planctomycete cytochrome C [Urbifossiella limnaea]